MIPTEPEGPRNGVSVSSVAGYVAGSRQRGHAGRYRCDARGEHPAAGPSLSPPGRHASLPAYSTRRSVPGCSLDRVDDQTSPGPRRVGGWIAVRPTFPPTPTLPRVCVRDTFLQLWFTLVNTLISVKRKELIIPAVHTNLCGENIFNTQTYKSEMVFLLRVQSENILSTQTCKT